MAVAEVARVAVVAHILEVVVAVLVVLTQVLALLVQEHKQAQYGEVMVITVPRISFMVVVVAVLVGQRLEVQEDLDYMLM
jgi:hypothetical protein